MDAFICNNIGQNDDGVEVIEFTDALGKKAFKASTRITHLFGSPINMDPIEAFGLTEQEARERLAKELRSFNDSLWA